MVGLGDKTEELLRRSIDLAVEAKDEFLKTNPNAKVFVAASVNPYGCFRLFIVLIISGAIKADGSEYSGDYMATTPLQEIKDFHRRRLEVLAKHPGLWHFLLVGNYSPRNRYHIA